MNLERVRAKTRLNADTGCWMWQGAVGRSGYGNVGEAGRTRTVHRVAWEARNGPIPPGLHVLHRCDTPLCVNPDHLFLGTHVENMRDRDRKGRGVIVRGDNNGKIKLHDAVVREARHLKWAGLRQCEIARRIGCHTATLNHWISGRRAGWR